MDLPGVGTVIGLGAEELGGFVNQFKKHIDADRVIRRPEHGARVLFAGGADAANVVEPPGGADDNGDAEAGKRFNVTNGSTGNGEFDRDVNAGEVLGGEAFEIRVVMLVEN